MDLVGQFSFPQGTNDIWGYADGSTEYALVGLTNGFSVVDITDPSNPSELFFISGSNSIWRDVKTWGKYAYVTTEAEDGLLIVDLSDETGQTYVYTEEFFTTSHNIYIDENGYAYIFGADTGNGGAVILDLTNDPMNPTLAGIFDNNYLHDGMVRGDTLWGSAIYLGDFQVIDVSDKQILKYYLLIQLLVNLLTMHGYQMIIIIYLLQTKLLGVTSELMMFLIFMIFRKLI